MKIYVGGSEVQTLKDSFSMNDVIEERSTCSFTVVDVDNIYKYTQNTTVLVEDEVRGIIIFSGFIHSISEEKISGTRGLFHKIECIDNHYLVDKRIIANAWMDVRAGQVVKDIVDGYLKMEDVSYVQDTLYPTIDPTFTDTNPNNYIARDYDGNGYFEVSIAGKGVSSIVPKLYSNNDGNGYVVNYVKNDVEDTVGDISSSYRLFNGTQLDGTDTATFYNLGDYIEIEFPEPQKIDRFILYWEYSDTSSADMESWVIRCWDGQEWVVADNTYNHDWYGSSYHTITMPDSLSGRTGLRERYYTKVRLDNGEPLRTQMGEFKIYSQAQLSANSTYTISDPLNFDTLGYTTCGGGEITWKETLPEGTTATIKTSIDGGSTWFTETNGGFIQSLVENNIIDLTGKKLLVKIELSADDLYGESPKVEDIKIDLVQSMGSIQPVNVLDEAVFNYIPISEALNAIAEKTNCWWKIDHNRVLHFGSRELYQAPISMGDMNVLKGSIKVQHGNNQYRNQQYIIGGKDITDAQTEEFLGNGKQRTFTLSYPLAKVPTILVDGVEVEKVGIRGLSKVEDGYEWFWSKGDNTINKHEDVTPLADGSVVTVKYQGEFDIVVVQRNPEEIARLNALENSSGYVENVREDKSIQSKSSGFTFASKILEKYGKIGRQVEFTTHLDGLESGQLVTATFPVHDIHNEELLIESVDISFESGKFFYKVKAVQNTVTESWTKFFYKISTQGRSYIIRENIDDDEVLVTLEVFEKTWTESEEPNIFKQTVPSDTTKPTSTTYPTFEEEDRVKFVAWFNKDVELGRKQIAKQTYNEATKELLSIAYLAPSEANGTITHFGWFGGEHATINKGTGILVDKQEYAREKSELEAMEIDKIDRKGW